MRTTSLYLALSVVSLAICAPVVSRSGSHPPATVPNSRPPHALPQIIHWGPDEDDDSFETSIDNRPITPTAGAEPSVVLQAPRPIITEYLMAISVKVEEKEKLKDQQGEEDREVALISKEDVSDTQPTHGNEEFISVAEMEIIVPGIAQRTRMPCERATYISREHSDMIIICLAVIFLLAVVVLETFPQRYVIYYRIPVLPFFFADLALRGRSRRASGEIRLEDEKGAAGSNSRGLSIQANGQ